MDRRGWSYLELVPLSFQYGAAEDYFGTYAGLFAQPYFHLAGSCAMYVPPTRASTSSSSSSIAMQQQRPLPQRSAGAGAGAGGGAGGEPPEMAVEANLGTGTGTGWYRHRHRHRHKYGNFLDCLGCRRGGGGCSTLRIRGEGPAHSRCLGDASHPQCAYCGHVHGSGGGSLREDHRG